MSGLCCTRRPAIFIRTFACLCAAWLKYARTRDVEILLYLRAGKSLLAVVSDEGSDAAQAGGAPFFFGTADAAAR